MLTICLQGRTERLPYLEIHLTKSVEGVVSQLEGLLFTSSQKRIIKVRFSDIQNWHAELRYYFQLSAKNTLSQARVQVLNLAKCDFSQCLNQPFPQSWMADQPGRWATPHFSWQYSALMSGVHGRIGNMSVLLFEPAGRANSVHAWKKSQVFF